MDENSQNELSFSGDGEGYNSWQQQRQLAQKRLARKLNLPLGYPVEVWLKGNILLRGKLCLEEEMLFVPAGNDVSLRLRVDKVVFGPHEIESCVRMEPGESV